MCHDLPEIEVISSGRVTLVLNWRGTALWETSIHWSDAGVTSRYETETGKKMQQALDCFMTGQPVVWPELAIPFHECSPFTCTVLKTLQKDVPPGKTVTYGELATMCGRPNAARGVGQIMARNRWPIVIPCHRVLAANGKIGGFSGQGAPMKRHLLGIEGVLLGE